MIIITFSNENRARCASNFMKEIDRLLGYIVTTFDLHEIYIYIKGIFHTKNWYRYVF